MVQGHPQGPQGFLVALSARGELDTKELKFLGETAHTDAEDHPAIRERIERSVALGDLQRMRIGQDHHMREETDPARYSREIAEGG